MQDRIISTVAGAIFGVCGIAILCVALVLALTPFMGQLYAVLSTGGLCLVLSGGLMWFAFARPQAFEEDVDEIEKVAAEAIADLPFDIIETSLEKRPALTIAAAAIGGYAIARNPATLSQSLDQFVKTISS